MKAQTNFKYFLVLLLGIGLNSPAFAVTMPHNTDFNSIKITFAELDMSSDEGVATLYQKIKSGARQVCGGRPNLQNPGLTRLYRKCLTSALDTAVKEIDNAKLTSLHST